MQIPDIVDFEQVVSSIPGLYLVVDRDRTVVAASDGYLNAAGVRREEVIGHRVFDPAADGAADAGSVALRDIADSLERVMDLARPDVMPIRSLGAPRRNGSDANGETVHQGRRWKPISTPVFDASGEIRWIIHSLEEVTEDGTEDGVAIQSQAVAAPLAQTRRRIVEELRWANGVLSALPDQMFLKLADHLSPIRISEGAILVEPLQPLAWVYFPLEGLNAAILHLADGSSTEVAMGGRGGLVGISVLTGASFEETETRARIAGSALRIRAGVLRDILAADPSMQAQLNWFVSMILSQIGLTAACNARHALDQRLARWLLTACRRIDRARLPVSQDAVALALGVRRSGVSEALGRFHTAGLVSTGRQSITILDFARLETKACDCFRESELSRERYEAAAAPERALPERIHELIDQWTKAGPPAAGGEGR